VNPKSKPIEPMLTDSISDAEYVQKLQRGQSDAFEALIRRHEKTIFNLVYRMLGDYDEAAETAQEVFLSAYRAIGQFRGDANFSTWLYRIALNHATTRRKSMNTRQQRNVSIDNTEPMIDPHPGPAESMEKKESVYSSIAFSVKSKMKNPSTLKEYIIFSEILGKPKALRR